MAPRNGNVEEWLPHLDGLCPQKEWLSGKVVLERMAPKKGQLVIEEWLLIKV